MAFDVAAFRLAFPEFTSTTTYPDAVVTMWGDVADLQVREAVWRTMTTLGRRLYVAHEITLARQNTQAVAVGGNPGQQGGVANTKTVGAGTIGYDTVSTTEKDAGFWNLTNYGKQFWRFAQMYGAGAIQI